LGLLVGLEGYPLAYEIFEGNKFEGHTMIPVIEAFRKKYKLPAPIVVADSGLLSKSNIQELRSNGYEFILGARLKASSDISRQRVLALELENGESRLLDWEEGLKMVVSYSDKRAKKDRINRDKGLRKLEKQLKTGKLNKTHINNRGYNKYLKMEGEVKVSIDMEKFEKDGKSEKGSKLSPQKAIEIAKGIYTVEMQLKSSGKKLRKTLFLNESQQKLAKMFGF
jgi:hypothetical protein